MGGPLVCLSGSCKTSEADSQRVQLSAMIEKVKRHEAELEAALKIAEVHKKVHSKACVYLAGRT